jgi:hypothetical protein
MGDHGPTAREAWKAREDSWLSRLRAIEPALLEGTEAAVPYTFSRERLEAASPSSRSARSGHGPTRSLARATSRGLSIRRSGTSASESNRASRLRAPT